MLHRVALVVFALATAAFAQPFVSHTLTAGPSDGTAQSFNLDYSLFNGDDWNASTLLVETFAGVTIVSPLDNTFGAFAPPFPDLGTAVDTYARSPSAPPLYLPQIAFQSYSPEAVNITWLDPAGTTSPAAFLSSRISFVVPVGFAPTFEPVGDVIAIVEISTATQLGGGVLATRTFAIYSGVQSGALDHDVELTESGGVYSLDLNLTASNGAIWTSSSIDAQAESVVTFLSPLDNSAGEWAPPVPDNPAFVDTYLRSPSAPDAIPLVSAGTYATSSLSAMWSDDPAGAAPSEFRAARLSFTPPAGSEPTLSPIGVPLLTVTVTSSGENVVTPDESEFVVYDGVIGEPRLIHTFAFGPSKENEATVDVSMLLWGGDDWNGAEMSIETFGGVTITDPTDNEIGEWFPPEFDLGLTIDTYVRAPGFDSAFPESIVLPSYSPTAAGLIWLDRSGSVTQGEFLGARVALKLRPGMVPTLEPVGEPIATVALGSITALGGGVIAEDSVTIYALSGLPGVTHQIAAGPIMSDAASFDISMHLTDGDDWNAGQISINTFEGVTIVSPDDNTFGAWFPPFPDDQTALDTYVRSPANEPTAFPTTLLPSYAPTSAFVAWIDPAGSVSPADFLGARVGLNLRPGMAPTLEPIGQLIAEIEISSTTQLGGGVVTTDTFFVYSGVAPEPRIEHAFSLGPAEGNTASVNVNALLLDGDNWNESTITITTASGVTIIDPLDNFGGDWRPPVTGSAIDTYLRDPENLLDYPTVLDSSYQPDAAMATWVGADDIVSPAEFEAARVGLLLPAGKGLTLDPTAEPVAVITIESTTDFGDEVTRTDSVTVYATDDPAGPQITHILSPGPSAEGEFSYDINMRLDSGDDWNTSQVLIETFGGVTIKDPTDNTFGPWFPAFPDDGTLLDTYLRSPSNLPTAFPQLVLPSYTPTSAFAAWLDPAGSVSPAEFLGARIGLLIAPDMQPTLEPIGTVIATINVASATQFGGGVLVEDSWTIYSGTTEGGITHTLAFGPADGADQSFDIFVETPADDDWNSSILRIDAYLGATILDPLDNEQGAWFPPLPDDLTAVDTYVRSPSSEDAFPLIRRASYSGTSALISWDDAFGATAPASFQAARVGLRVPEGAVPSLDTGSLLARFVMTSRSENSESPTMQALRVYDGVIPRLQARCEDRGGEKTILGAVRNGSAGAIVTLTLDDSTALSVTLDGRGQGRFFWPGVEPGPHTVTLKLDSGATVVVDVDCP